MKKKIMIILGMMILLVSCDNTIHVKFDRNEFDTQRAAWQASNVTKYSYEYVSFWLAHPYGVLLVDVSGDDVSAVYKETGESFDIRNDFTIDDLYDSILGIYNEYNGMRPPVCDVYTYHDNIEVTYDKENHIPIKIYSETKTGNGRLIGAYHYNLEIKNFEKK